MVFSRIPPLHACTPTGAPLKAALLVLFTLFPSLAPSFSSRLALLLCRFHPALLFPVFLPPGFLSQLPSLPASLLFGPQLVPLSEPPADSPRQAPEARKRRRRLAIEHAIVSEKKKRTQQITQRPEHTFASGSAPARTNVCVRSYVEEAAHELRSYVRLRWRT